MRAIIFFITSFLISLVIFFNTAAWATEGLPSQKARFEGMGSTFKKQKEKAASVSDVPADSRSQNSKNDMISDDDSSTYFRLHTFVVNVIDERDVDKLLFLTLEIYCKISNIDEKWLVDFHLAAIKDTIISYISGLKRQNIQTQKQKKTLQQELTLRVSNTLKTLSGKEVISNLYLTRIIIQ